MRRVAATSSIVLAFGAVTILPAAASHGGGGEVERRGNCSAKHRLEAQGQGRRRPDRGRGRDRQQRQRSGLDLAHPAQRWRLGQGPRDDPASERVVRGRATAGQRARCRPDRHPVDEHRHARDAAPGTSSSEPTRPAYWRRDRSNQPWRKPRDEQRSRVNGAAARPRSCPLGPPRRAVRGSRRGHRRRAARHPDLVQPTGRNRRGHRGGPQRHRRARPLGGRAGHPAGPGDRQRRGARPVRQRPCCTACSSTTSYGSRSGTPTAASSTRTRSS